MANGHDGGVGGTRLRIFSAHYRAFKLQPLSRLRRQLPFLIKIAHGARIRIGGYGLHRGALARSAIGARFYCAPVCFFPAPVL